MDFSGDVVSADLFHPHCGFSDEQPANKDERLAIRKPRRGSIVRSVQDRGKLGMAVFGGRDGGRKPMRRLYQFYRPHRMYGLRGEYRAPGIAYFLNRDGTQSLWPSDR